MGLGGVLPFSPLCHPPTESTDHTVCLLEIDFPPLDQQWPLTDCSFGGYLISLLFGEYRVTFRGLIGLFTQLTAFKYDYPLLSYIWIC